MFSKAFPAAQDQDRSSLLKTFSTPTGRRRRKGSKSCQAHISEPILGGRESSDNRSISPWRSASPFGQNAQLNIDKLTTPGVQERTTNLTPSPRSERSESIREEKDDFELEILIHKDSALQAVEEPSYSAADDQEEMFSGDQDVKIAELTLKCAKIKQKWVSEKQSVVLLRQQKDELKQSLENERKRYNNLEANFCLKEKQMNVALEETNNLEQKLRKASIDDTTTAKAGKWKKDMFIPDDLEGFMQQLNKIQNSKNKLEELASQIFDKYYSSKQTLGVLNKASKETREKYNKLLFDYGELSKTNENMQKEYDYGKDRIDAMRNDMEVEIDRKLQPSQNTIDRLKKEIIQSREQFQGETVALKQENSELLAMFKDLEKKKDSAEDALLQKTKQSEMMADKLLRYKSQVEQHELTIRKWKCYQIKDTNYLQQGFSNRILQSRSKINAEIKKEFHDDNVRKNNMTEMTLRIYKIPATGIMYFEIGSESTNSIVPVVRRELFDIRSVRHLLTESGEVSNKLSITLPDHELLLQSSQSEEIMTTFDAILEVNNQWMTEDTKEDVVEPVKMKRLRRFSLPNRREKSPMVSPSSNFSLPILSEKSETQQNRRTSVASFFTCI